MICYLDSSIVLSSLLGEERLFKGWEKISFSFSSILLKVEVSRVLYRLRLQGMLSDRELSLVNSSFNKFLTRITLYEITSEVIERASAPFATIIASLDALHLSTALLWRENQNKEIGFLTFDEQLKTAARASGLGIIE